ncbi:hypothetical protein PF003_g10546 [Phytophthora fragariae]|nr:hypothetical protein PF003_g10546 [Phytophthora fragariae]
MRAAWGRPPLRRGKTSSVANAEEEVVTSALVLVPRYAN